MNKQASEALIARVSGLEWESSEWADGGYAAVLRGIVIDIVPEVEGDEWHWTVRPSSARCEWPELYASGHALTLRAARIAAAHKAAKADAQYPTIAYS